MKKDIKDIWVTALRSGKYEQGKEALRRSNDKFCCLGVLCDLFQKETGRAEWEGGGIYYKMDNEAAYLISDVTEWSGMQSTDGRFMYEDKGISIMNTLATLNDNGKSFEEIANVIEENWEQL
jgi:hypothetical protein